MSAPGSARGLRCTYGRRWRGFKPTPGRSPGLEKLTLEAAIEESHRATADAEHAEAAAAVAAAGEKVELFA